MEVHFRPDDFRTSGDGVRSPVAPALPREVLERHGARMLRPTEALRAPDTPVPQPTAYRSTVLLVPEELVGDGGERINQALMGTGASVVLPRLEFPPSPEGRPAALRPVALRPRAGEPLMSVDAWSTLQR